MRCFVASSGVFAASWDATGALARAASCGGAAFVATGVGAGGFTRATFFWQPLIRAHRTATPMPVKIFDLMEVRKSVYSNRIGRKKEWDNPVEAVFFSQENTVSTGYPSAGWS